MAALWRADAECASLMRPADADDADVAEDTTTRRRTRRSCACRSNNSSRVIDILCSAVDSVPWRDECGCACARLLCRLMSCRYALPFCERYKARHGIEEAQAQLHVDDHKMWR